MFDCGLAQLGPVVPVIGIICKTGLPIVVALGDVVLDTGQVSS